MKKVCKNCGKEFFVKPSHWEERVNCSKECMKERYKDQLKGKNNPNWSGALMKVECKICGKIFTFFRAYKNVRKCCSVKCSAKYRSFLFYEKKKNKKPELSIRAFRRKVRICFTCKKCVICGVKVRNKIRCDECAGKIAKRIRADCECLVCGKKMKRLKSQIKEKVFCSACNHKKTGKLNSNWRGGRVKERAKIRASREFKEWRRAVFERDNYTCQKCFQVGYELHAHHIKQFAFFPELRFEISNGLTLCKSCHLKLPRRRKKAINLCDGSEATVCRGADEAIDFVKKFFPCKIRKT